MPSNDFLCLIVLVVVTINIPFTAPSKCSKRPLLFNFGDSNSDTGGYEALLASIKSPNGRTFFGRPSGRLCDGRLVLDFLAEDLKIGYLTPYLESLKPNFKHGVNFALAGSAAMPGAVCPYFLKAQVNEFLRFYNRSLQLGFEGDESLLKEDEFINALYMFDIGQNDLKNAFDTITDLDRILEIRIPLFITYIKEAMQAIYANGGRKFWIHNTGPLGCLPGILSLRKPNASEVDEHGCVESENQAAREFNSKLNAMCEQLRSELQNSTIVYVDVYAAKYNLLASASSYGFERPLIACVDGNNTCEEGPAAQQYISWDGFHYTEAANSLVAAMILSGNYSSPHFLFKNFFC